MSTTVYAATYIEKEIEEDSFAGDPGYDRMCMLSQAIAITAATLPALIKAVGDRYELDIDGCLIPVTAGDADAVGWFGYSRRENADGAEPDEDELAEWRAGRCTLWIADYTVTIEKRAVTPVTRGDFAAAAVKVHG